VNETLSLEELNRSVDRRWRGPPARFFEPVQQIVRTDGPVGSQDQRQDLPAEFGKANAVSPANISSLIEVVPDFLQTDRSSMSLQEMI
jgi:hypothetical protein